MKYKSPDFYTQEQIDSIEIRANTLEVADMIIGVAFNENKLELAFNICVKYASSDNDYLVGVALEGISHLARRFKKLPYYAVRRVILANINKNSDDIKWGLAILEEDLKTFMPGVYDELF